MSDDLKTDLPQADEAGGADIQQAISRAVAIGADDPASAAEQLRNVLAEHPGEETVLRALVGIERKIGEGAELAQAMSALAGVVGDHGEKRVLLHEAAQIFRTTGKFGDEVAAFIRLLEIDPSDADVIKALEDACERNGDWDTLSDLFERDAQESQVPDERATAFFKLADLWFNRMNSPEISVDFIEKAVREKPEIQGAAVLLEQLAKFPESAAKASDLLEKHFRGSDYWEGVAARLEAEGREVHDKALSRQKLFEAADIHSNRLNQPDMALLTIMKLFRTDFNDVEVLDRLWNLAVQNRQQEEISEVFQEALATGGTTPETKLAIAKKLSGSDSYWDSRSVPTIEAMEAFYRSENEWEKLADLLKKHVPLESDPGAARAIWIDLAETLGLRTGRKDEAVEAARRLLDLEQHTVEELDRIAAVLENLETWEDLARALVIKADLIEDPTRRTLNLMRAAGLYRREIGNDSSAKALYEKVMALDPGGTEAFNALCDLYTAQGDWHKLIELLDTLLSSTSDRHKRAELLRQVAAIYKDKLDQAHMAFMTWCRIWREDLADMSALGTAEALAADTGAWEELYFLYQEAIDSIKDMSLLAEIRNRAAKIASERLDMADEAEGHLREVLEADSSNVHAIDSMAAFLERRERWADLVGVLRKKVEHLGTAAEKAALCVRIGEILDSKLGDKNGAVAAYKEAHGFDHADPVAYETLCSLLERESLWEDLAAAHLEQAKVVSDPGESEAARLKAASLVYKKVGDLPRAAGIYREVLSADPGCRTALTALDDIYTAIDEYKDLLEILEWRIAVEGDKDLLVELHSRAASICADLLSDPVRAARHYEELLAVRPSDEASLEALEVIYGDMGAWEKLVETCRRHVEASEDAAKKVGLLTRMAEVYTDGLAKPAQSAELYRNVLDLDGSNLNAVRKLSAFYKSEGNWSEALEMLEREASLLGSSKEAVAVWHSMGAIHNGTLLDPASARDCYLKAIEIDPAHLESLRAVKAIYASEKNHAEYLKTILEEARYVESVADKTALYFEAGGLYDWDRNDPVNAAGCYEEALRLTPDYIPAARVLSDIYFKREDWIKARACMDVVVKGLDPETAGKELARCYYRLGYVNERLKDYEKAFEAYSKSGELESGRMPVAEGIATSLVKLERWDDAARAYEKIVSEFGDGLSDAEIAELEFQIGELFQKVGNSDEAITAFERVMKADDRHIKALSALMELRESRGEYEEAFDLMLQLAALHEGRERFDLYMRMGTLCRDRLEDAYRAIDAFLGAMRAMDDGPSQLPAMDELYKLFKSTSQFVKSAEMLEKIVGIESDGKKLAGYYLGLAEILDGELGDPDRAVDAYNKVLDLDPTESKAFIAIETLLAGRKEWRKLEENYRAMIQRTPKEAKGKRIVLWRNLGELYRRVLRDTDAAVMAYEVVHGYEKENLETLEVLADLYSSKEKFRDKALQAHHTVLRMTANPAKSCKALKRFYLSTREFDKAYAVSSVLKYLGQTDSDDEKVLTQLGPRVREMAARPLTEEAWETGIIHPKAKGAVASVMAYLKRHMGSAFSQSVESFGVRKKDMVDVDKSQLYFVNMFKYAVRAMGTGDFLLYRAPAGMTGLRLVFSNPVSILAGEDMFKERPKKELWFKLGRELTLARPEFAVAAMLPAGELFALWSAVLSLVSPAHAQQAATEQILKWRDVLLKNLTQDNLTSVRALLSGYLREGGGSNIEGWLEAVEYTCLRAGLVLSGDLSISMTVAQEAPGRLAKPAFRSIVRETVMYSVSEEYLALREKLGLSVQV